ncbi:MAG: hypothetical protein ACR2JH_05860, partial [Solirubrobacteraceae bacterium]
FRSQVPVPSRAGGGWMVSAAPRRTRLGCDYDVVLGVHEPGDTAPGIDRMLSFSVAGAEAAEGIVDLRGSWSFNAAPVEVAR